MKITIKKSSWLRGAGGHVSCLLDSNGHSCCLGFVCKQIGIPEKDIKEIANPNTVANNLAHIENSETVKKLALFNLTLIAYERIINSDFSVKAIAINDCKDKHENERETELIALFARNGLSLVFED